MQALDRNVVEGSSNILSENFEGILFDFSAQERNMIEGIRFYKTLKNVPEMAKDVSQNKDGSVRAWVEDACLHIAGNGKVVAPENCEGLFSGYGKARSIYFFDCFDTTQVTNMSHMFSNCSSLVTLNLYEFDTSNVTDMSSMFEGCNSLGTIEIGKMHMSKFDTSKVTNMRSMFSGCSSLIAIDLSNFDTSKVTNMNSMFSGCKTIKNLDVWYFDTAQVLDMGSMFYGCEALTTVSVCYFDTSKVTRMSKMFYWCDELFEWNGNHYTSEHIDIRKWDVSNVIAFNDFVKIKNTTDAKPKIKLYGKPWADYFR